MPPAVMHLPDFAARRPKILLALYCLALWLPGMLALPPTDRDESRFAQATKQMLETSDLIDIRNGVEARNRKPIGIYWLQAPGVALARAAGLASENPIWPYRLPSLAGALVGVLATFAVGRRIAGVQAGMLAAGMLASSVLLATEANIAKTDAALLGATTLAMGVLARAYLGTRVSPAQAALFWLAVGAGILIKGPLTPMVAGLTALSLVLLDRRTRWLAALRPRWGVPLMLAVVLPWFVAIGMATHGRFFADAVGDDLAGKIAGGDDAHGAPPGYHLLLLSLTLFPSGAAALCSLPSAWRGRREPATRFLLAWLVPSWLVFECVPTKLPHYPLPVFPALCLLAAGWLVSPARRPPPRWLARLARGLNVTAAVVLALGGGLIPVVLDRGLGATALLGVPALVLGGLLAWALARTRDRRRATLLGIAAVPLLYWSILGLELPSLPTLWIAPRVRDALVAHGAPTAFAASGYAEPSLMFLCGTGTALLANGVEAARFLATAEGRVVAVEQRTLTQFQSAATDLRMTPRAFAEVSGFNYSNGRRVTLTLFDLDGSAPARPAP